MIISPLKRQVNAFFQYQMHNFSTNCLIFILLFVPFVSNAFTNNDNSECRFENPKLNFKKKELRVLDIGNSFTLDATHYIPNLVEAAGIDCSDMCLYVAHRGSASFKSWCDVYNNCDNASYAIYKKVGGLDADISGVADIGNGEQFRNTLKNNVWDLIIIHQVSLYSADFEAWTTNSNSGYLDELLSIIRENQPDATIGFLLVHSTASFYSGNPEHSTYARWEKIANSALRMQEDYNMDIIVPYGTAIESMRHTEYNNEMELTAEGLHLCSGLGDYTASCAYFEAIFTPRYEVSVLGNEARLIGLGEENAIDVNDENAYVAQLCAREAIRDFKSIANIVMPQVIFLNINSINLQIGERVAIIPTIFPQNTTDKTVVWSSSDPNIALVDEIGIVKAINYGIATITAKCGGITADCLVTVKEDTGIRDINIDSSIVEKEYYDLSGRKVQDPERGFYIHNGHKLYINKE